MYRVQMPGNYGGAFGTWDFHVFLSHRVAKVIGTWDFRGAKIFFFPAPGSDCDRDQEGSFRGAKMLLVLCQMTIGRVVVIRAHDRSGNPMESWFLLFWTKNRWPATSEEGQVGSLAFLGAHLSCPPRVAQSSLLKTCRFCSPPVSKAVTTQAGNTLIIGWPSLIATRLHRATGWSARQ